MSAATTRLEYLRADPTLRAAGFVAGTVVGLAVAQVHWLGFLLGGALAGLAAPTLRRGLAYGLAFGVVALAAFALSLALAGTLGAYAAMGQVAYVGVAVPVVAGLVGSLVRGVV